MFLLDTQPLKPYTVSMIIFKQNKTTITLSGQKEDLIWLYKQSRIITQIFRGKGIPPIETETRLWNGRDLKVTLGAGYYLISIMEKFGEPYTFEEKEKLKVLEIDTDLAGIDNRDYQIQAVRAVLENPIGLVHGAVNAGKTEIMAMVCKNFQGSILILVPTDILLRQTHKRLTKYFGDIIGLCGSGQLDLSKRIIIGIDKSAVTKLKDHKFDMIMVDECHKHLTVTARKVLERQPQARVYGFSGTPFRKGTSGRKFLDWAVSTCLYGKVIAEVSTVELMELGISSSGKCFWVEAKARPENLPMVYGENENLVNHQNYIVYNPCRNVQIGNICVEANKFGLVVCVAFRLLEHVDRMKAMLLKIYPEHDIAVITGKTKAKERDLILEGITKGKFKIVLVSGTFGVGTSINELDVLINAAGGLSNYQSIQRFGRILRNNKGRVFTYVDFIDKSLPSLWNHSRQRKKDVEMEIGQKIQKVKLSNYLTQLKLFWKDNFKIPTE